MEVVRPGCPVGRERQESRCSEGIVDERGDRLAVGMRGGVTPASASVAEHTVGQLMRGWAEERPPCSGRSYFGDVDLGVPMRHPGIY